MIDDPYLQLILRAYNSLTRGALINLYFYSLKDRFTQQRILLIFVFTAIKAVQRRAEVYESLDKLDEALADYQRVLEIDPSQHAARAACMVSI